MKTRTEFTLFLSLVMLFAFSVASVAAAPIVSTGYDPAAVLKGGVRYRAFNQPSQREIFLGKPDLGVGANRVELDCVWVSPGTNHVKFSYDSVLGKLTTVVTCGVNVYTLIYSSGNLGTLNYMHILVASRQSGATVGLDNVMLDSISLGNFDPPGLVWSDWKITNYDFSNGFVIEGDLVLTGTQPTGSETNKVEIDVGYVAPPPPPPVGGEWVPINTVQMLVHVVGSIVAISAIAASFVGFKRIKRKHD
jgi:hypothetical protein